MVSHPIFQYYMSYDQALISFTGVAAGRVAKPKAKGKGKGGKKVKREPSDEPEDEAAVNEDGASD